MGDAGWVDQLTGVMSDDHAFDMYLAGLGVNLHICDPGRPGGAKTWPAAVDVARIGETLALKPTILRALQLWLVVGFPAGAVGGGLNQFACSGVLNQSEAIFDWVNTRRGR